MKPGRFLPLAALLLTGCAGLQQERVSLGPLTDCPKQTAQTLAETQDQLGAFSDSHTLACALSFLRGDNPPALRRTALGSRLCLHLAERETVQDKREKLAAEGVKFAETALAKGGDGDGEVHYYLATNLGLAVREHVTLAMDNLGRLESELKRAVALNPGLDDGGPLRVLGTLYLKAPAWPNGIGDQDKALELLQRAVKEHPNHPLNHLFYAQALWEVDSDANADQAKAELALGLITLEEGKWGYRKQPWQKEFDEFKQDMDEAELSGTTRVSLAR